MKKIDNIFLEKYERRKTFARTAMEEMFGEGREESEITFNLIYSSEELDLRAKQKNGASVFCYGLYSGYDLIIGEPANEDEQTIIDSPLFEKVLHEFGENPICFGVMERIGGGIDGFNVTIHFLSKKQIEFLDKEF